MDLESISRSLLAAQNIAQALFEEVIDAWEADFGRTYALGSDPRKHQLVEDIAAAFQRGKEPYRCTPDLTSGELYEFVAGLAEPRHWILEIHFIDRSNLIGGFLEELLTINACDAD